MEETKVVINACYGGFSLSDEGKREYLRRAGKTWTERIDETFGRWTVFTVDGKEYWGADDIQRDDPILVSVVEDMGREAGERYTNLVVKALPKGTLYRIDEYDGYESIETRDGIDWSVA